MFIGVINVFIGLLLFNSSISSLRKSVIRKWRQGFSINFALSIILMIAGLLMIVFEPSVTLLMILYFIIMCGVISSCLIISKINI